MFLLSITGGKMVDLSWVFWSKKLALKRKGAGTAFSTIYSIL